MKRQVSLLVVVAAVALATTAFAQSKAQPASAVTSAVAPNFKRRDRATPIGPAL